jgi:hypothetical protein
MSTLGVLALTSGLSVNSLNPTIRNHRHPKRRRASLVAALQIPRLYHDAITSSRWEGP